MYNNKMKNKKIHFVSGLPRSCSTLLCNILAQNPQIHSTPTSLLHEIGYIARKVFQTEEAKTVDGETVEKMYLDYVRAGTENAFNSITDRPIVVDKCRSWIGHLDQTFKIWPNAKILVPVRDIRGVMCSMEKKFQLHPSPFNGVEEANPQNWTTLEKRIQGWLSSPPVGIAIERLWEASRRFGDRLLYVHAEKLCSNPNKVINEIYNYFEMESYEHNFKNVEQYTKEHDIGFPYGDHTIRSEVKSLKKDWNEVIGKQMSDTLFEKFQWINSL
jgi:sulfotransferase